MSPQIWWYVARSSGLIAAGLITLSVCWGLFISTKAVAKATAPAWLLDLHRYLGGLSVVFTAVHIVGLVADNYVHFGWAEVLVPFASAWKTGAVAWGVVAFYLLIAIELTSLMMKRLPRRIWLRVHRASFPLFVLVSYHGLTAGTDQANHWYRLATLCSVNIVAFLTIVLIFAKRKAFIAAASPQPGNRRPVEATA